MNKFPMFQSCRACSAHACFTTQEKVILIGKTYLRTIPCTLCAGSDPKYPRVDVYKFIHKLRVSLHSK